MYDLSPFHIACVTHVLALRAILAAGAAQGWSVPRPTFPGRYHALRIFDVADDAIQYSHEHQN